MPVLNEEERQQLAEKLAGLSYPAARKEIRRLDSKANLKIWRNGVRHEIHTMYELPTLGIRVILVEDQEVRPIRDNTKVRKFYHFSEARVEAWTPPV